MSSWSSKWTCKLCRKTNPLSKSQCIFCNSPKHEVRKKSSSLEERLFRCREIIDDHWIWTGAINSHGYGQISIDDIEYGVHRVSASIWLGLDLSDSKQQANHKQICSYRACFNPDHIYVGTQADNMRDASLLGTNTMNKIYKDRNGEWHERD